MSTSTGPRKDQEIVPASAHLTVRPEGDGPRQARFMFEQPDSKRIGGQVGAGFLTELIIVGIVLLIGSLIPQRVYKAVLPPQLSERIIFLSEPGPGGGGGGGNKMPDPPKPAEIAKPKPAPVIPKPVEPPPVEPPPVEPITIPLKTLDATVTTPGTIESTQASNSISLGPGTGTGAGPGQGSGIGEGFGGGAYRPGNGVLLPKPIREVKPQYTADAMRAKVQGTVLLECVVMPDGTVGKVEVVRSLDSAFGLDQEAIKAAKQWRFQPGTRFGEPVAVLVTIELTFTLR